MPHKGEKLKSAPGNGPMPVDSANILSQITFWYSLPLIKISKDRTLTENDLWDVVEAESAKTTSVKLNKAWEKEKKANPKKPSFIRCLMFAFAPMMLFSSFCAIMWAAIIVFVPIYLVRNLILFVQTPNAEASGWGYVAGFFGASLVQSIFLHQVFWTSFRFGSRMRSAACALIYEKALRLSTAGNIGEIANLVTNDCMRIQELGVYFNFVLILPLQVGAVGGLLIWKIGWSGIIGLVFMIIMAGWQLYAGRLVKNYRIKAVRFTDQRVKLMSEILMAIKLVKFYAWEVPFAQRVSDSRAVEVRQIRNLAFIRAINFILMFVTSSFTTLLVFAAFVGSGHTLTAENAFVALALINSVRFTMNMLPMGVRAIAEARVSSGRVQAFLAREELPPRQPETSIDAVPAGTPIIEIKDGDFSWENEGPHTLRDINLRIPRGHLVAVVGPVGSGKSTLLAAMMEQITRVRGTVTMHGSAAFVPQQAWIQNMTLRDNVLFGSRFDEEKYLHTIQVCALEPDLKQLLAGDQTEIGERGINLSGGQKQRVSIARAVYADKDVVLMDDPLSAVDQHVGKHLFEKCIKTALAGKTVILVTHQLQYLPKCDSVIVMSSGTISAHGTFNELMSKLDFSELIGQHVDLTVEAEAGKQEVNPDERDEPGMQEAMQQEQNPEQKNKEAEPKKDGTLIKAEEQKAGNLGGDTYKQYIYNGGAIVFIVVMIFHILSQGATIMSFWWLTFWTTHPGRDGLNIGIYAMLVAAVLIFCTVRELMYQSFTLRASTNIHNLMFRTILRAPMVFFDTTPLGRILNRFAVDMDIIDYQLPDMSMQALHNTFMVLGVIALISAFLHYMPALLVPMAILFFLAQHYYRNANRDIKRIDSASKSPLFQHLSATLSGLPVLRAFRQEARFSAYNEVKIDHTVRSGLQMYMIQRWLGFSLDFITTLLVFATAALCVGVRDQITAAQAGLAVTYSMQLAGTFQWTVRTIADSEAQMTSVERILDYCNPDLEEDPKKRKKAKKIKRAVERLAYEAPPIIPDVRPDQSWPAQGIVKFDHVTIEYVKGTPVLHDLTFETLPMEKIGIVGRTGAGKSTVALALFRMMECAHGHIIIDGQDISLIGTHDLRARVGIIPQDPVLFEGTVRSNLDPFGTYPDDAIWRTLQQVHLHEAVAALPNKLDALVEANGENWSVGQRQLICIGRALLKHCKLLVLDEATAAVDLETDSLIQETIRENFHDCTILTIAHRLNTIIDSDRVMVLDKGKIIEFDHPAILLESTSENAIFRSMVAKMGPAAFARLSGIANEALMKKHQNNHDIQHNTNNTNNNSNNNNNTIQNDIQPINDHIPTQPTEGNFQPNPSDTKNIPSEIDTDNESNDNIPYTNDNNTQPTNIPHTNSEILQQNYSDISNEENETQDALLNETSSDSE
eukprot:Phypoly_transcript_00483.p1 GENE.Phypoly_transcript_00483~~Phypoly_transcript_00483.p1  ORF type:complete len:1415 (-),score=265.79 Phypoly_transcript_00483:241-4485(-)